MRIAVVGPPGCGKTTWAKAESRRSGSPVLHTDDLIGKHDWSECSSAVCAWLYRPGPWIIEGVATVRALRKWLAREPEGKPCDVVVMLDAPYAPWNKGQAAMAKGHAKIWDEIVDELEARGVEATRP